MATWLITYICIKFNFLPKSHDWYGRKPFRFQQWILGRTKLCESFDTLFYISFGLLFGFGLGKIIN